jgi:hypothetical protein
MEGDCVLHFVKGLNDNFNTLKSQVLLMSPLPSINQVFSICLRTERGAGNSSLGNVLQSMDHPVMAVGNTFNTTLPVGDMNLSNAIVEGTIFPSGILPTRQNRKIPLRGVSTAAQFVQFANAVGGQFRRFNKK